MLPAISLAQPAQDLLTLNVLLVLSTVLFNPTDNVLAIRVTLTIQEQDFATMQAATSSVTLAPTVYPPDAFHVEPTQHSNLQALANATPDTQ